MPWTEKSHPSSLDHQPIEGLQYLDGAVVAYFLSLKSADTDAWWINLETLKGLKSAQVEFPSGLTFSIREAPNAQQGGLLHLFGVIELPYFGSRDDAWQQIQSFAHVMGYSLVKRGENQLEVHGSGDEEHLLIIYDLQAGCIEDITLPQRPEHHAPPQLLDHETRARLPKLRSTEALGLDALAQVKFVDPRPDGWIWFATEFDGHDLFFGLVIGFEIELGYFSLSELQQLQNQLGYPIERDPHFTPTSLKDLRTKYIQERD